MRQVLKRYTVLGRARKEASTTKRSMAEHKTHPSTAEHEPVEENVLMLTERDGLSIP